MVCINKTQKKQKRVSYNVFNNTKRDFVLTVRKTNKYIYLQLDNIVEKKTVTTLSSRSIKKAKYNRAISRELGTVFGKQIKEKFKNSIELAFNRNSYPYHGCIKELAEGAREAGLVF